MRHTCVSLLLHLGVAPDMVREIVGHSDIEVTMTIYAHTALDEKRQALAKLGRRADLAKASKLAVAVTVAVKRPGRRNPPGRFGWSDCVVRGGVEPPTFRFSGGRSYQLSYLTSTGPPHQQVLGVPTRAVLTGFEPATSTLTGWRALRAALQDHAALAAASSAPNGIRTRAAALKGRCPRPLDDGGSTAFAAVSPWRPPSGTAPA